jgi:phosphate-selective porin OprO/OprP
MDKVNKANSAKTELQGVWKDGFGFTTGDGQHSIKLTGRLQTDYRWIDSGNNNLAAAGRNDRDTASTADGFELRRARFGVQGFMYKDINYKAEWNLVGGAPVVDEAYVNFAYYKPVQLTFGRFKQPFSLEQLTSSNSTDFMERSYNDQNGVPAKKLGAMVSGEPTKGFTYAASLFQEGLNEQTDADGTGKRYAGRLTANLSQLLNLNNSVLHVGVAGVGGDYQLRPAQSSQSSNEYESVTRASVVDFRTMNRGMQHFYRAQLAGQDLAACANVATSATSCGARNGTLGETSVNVSSRLLGLESAVAYKSLKLQGEYVRNEINAFNPVVSGTAGNPGGVGAGGTPGATTNNGSTTTSDARQTLKGDVTTWYAEAVWNVTGEKWSDVYSGGVFKGVKPTSNFKPGSGWGALQLAVRYSNVDAGGINVTGGGSRIQSGRSGTTANGGLAVSAENTTEVSSTSGSTAAATVKTADNVDSAGARASSSATRGGKMNSDVDSWGIGLNWLLNPNAKVMLDYTRTNFGGPTCQIDTDVRAGTKCSDHEDVVSVRAQYNF